MNFISSCTILVDFRILDKLKKNKIRNRMKKFKIRQFGIGTLMKYGPLVSSDSKLLNRLKL